MVQQTQDDQDWPFVEPRRGLAHDQTAISLLVRGASSILLIGHLFGLKTG